MTERWRKIAITLNGKKTELGGVAHSERSLIRSSGVWQVIVDTDSLFIAIQGNGRIWLYAKETS